MLLAACRKTRNEASFWTAPPSCDERTETQVDGTCVLKPEYTRFGDLTLQKGGLYWTTMDGCASIDSAAIAFKIDTVAAQQYFLSIGWEWYVSDPNKGTVIDPPVLTEPNYFPDPVRGDSVHFTLRTKEFDWLKPDQSRVGKFYGRFDPQRTLLTGKIMYTTGYDGPETGEVCENVTFKPLL